MAIFFVLPHLFCTLEGGWCHGQQRQNWMDNIRKWTSMPLVKLFTMASCRKDWKKISAESSHMFPNDPVGQGTELNWACWICLGRSAFDDLRLLSIIFGGLLVSPLWVPFETAVLVVWGWRWGVGNSTSCQQHWVISGWWRRGADRLAHCHDKAVCTWLNVTEWCMSWFNWFKLSWICHFDWLAD